MNTGSVSTLNDSVGSREGGGGGDRASRKVKNKRGG